MSVGTDAGAEMAVPTLRWLPEMSVGTDAGAEVAVPMLRWVPEMSVGTDAGGTTLVFSQFRGPHLCSANLGDHTCVQLSVYRTAS